MYFICSRSKRFHLGLSRESWCPPSMGHLVWQMLGIAVPRAMHWVTFKLEGFLSLAVGLPPRYVVGCAVLAHENIPHTSSLLCLTLEKSLRWAGLHWCFPLGEICLYGQSVIYLAWLVGWLLPELTGVSEEIKNTSLVSLHQEVWLLAFLVILLAFLLDFLDMCRL